LTVKQEELCDQSRSDFSDLKAIYIDCTLKLLARAVAHAGTRRPLDHDHGAQRRLGRGRAGGGSPDRHGRMAGHDRARLERDDWLVYSGTPRLQGSQAASTM
jgi:hypothetical protein